MKNLFLMGMSILMIAACVETRPVETVAPAYDSQDERLLNNVRVKSYDEHGITYEYKNMRIDEIASLASEYCHEQKERKAVLHDSQLYRNFSRRATFYCL